MRGLTSGLAQRRKLLAHVFELRARRVILQHNHCRYAKVAQLYQLAPKHLRSVLRAAAASTSQPRQSYSLFA
jgi:hypothetical protein